MSHTRPVPGPRTFRSTCRSLCIVALGISTFAATQSPAANIGMQVYRLAFLCEWRKQNAPETNLEGLPYCDDPTVTPDVADDQANRWWKFWYENIPNQDGYSLRNKFDSEFNKRVNDTAGIDAWGPRPFPEEHKVDALIAAWQKSEAGKIAAKVAADEEAAEIEVKRKAKAAQARFDASVRSATDEQLCSAVHRNNSKTAYHELQARGKISPDEWDLVNQHRIALGMSEIALRCSWGDPVEINSTVTASIQHKQYVFGHRTFVYVDNGHVSGEQDSR